MSILNSGKSDLQTPNKTKAVRFQIDFNLKSLLLNFVKEKDRNLYEELLCQIRNVGQEIRDDDLTQLLKEARGCISILDTNFRLFVQVVLILRWAHRSAEVVDEYKGFLQELCLAHNYYTKQVIDHLVICFKCDNGDWANSEPNEDSVRCFNNLHQTIKSILSLIPMSKEILISSLKKNYPYMKKPSHEHEIYVYNALQIIQYVPSLREEIFKLIITNLIHLDAFIQRSELLPENTVEITAVDDPSSNFTESHFIAHSLDLSLTQIYRFIRQFCYPDEEKNDFDKTKSLFLDIVKIFEFVILPTHAIHHVQFIIFYMASFKQTLANSLLQTLWKKVIKPTEAPLIRQAAAIYIASLISRAKYISVITVQEMLTEMTKWAHHYITSQEDNLYYDFQYHCVFYSICQAIFYMIAFRYKELIQGKGLALLQGLNLGKIVTCRLNPLKACVPTIVEHFASVSRLYQLAYCYSIMEHNGRYQLPQVRRDVTGSATLIQQCQLDAYFPFDPYLLNRSRQYINPHYMEYSGSIEKETSVPMEADEDSEDDFLEATDNVDLKIFDENL